MTAALAPHPHWSAPVPGGVTGVVLAGGQGRRMGGIDKGLQTFRGAPLALHALLRLQRQRGGWIGPCLINANRHLAAYEALGVPVWPDVVDGSAGPLAGMLTGLVHAATPWVLTVPCDSPLLPLDLAERLAQAVTAAQADVALAAAPQDGGAPRPQPVFALIGAHRLDDLQAFLQSGGRKIDAWTARQRCVVVPFDRPDDDPMAFANINTLSELQALETAGAVPSPAR
ncbi:Molybdenum cofactor guanylyltransferase [Tepidimonas alkaliphilus]|uniref:Molybdenum cofactor guanylyltransferase n=1 Tax=Tepidimonas alkaliphilus TaxID=2588942 RepID=A0A554WDL2_9BURK|nr:molybdenum cofactor guanylyltransferase MobA [Tepidimonas alkaliphilus]TSE21646.1 Molybdenum cofactor guanylyltransferase [Tepidimonas alkaliphilus]